MKSKLVIVALLAFAAGGTCPSDVNNDGTVGINDFLQLLGDWGPCPNATVVALTNVLEAGLTARIWSDNTLEIGMDIDRFDSDWGCAEAFPRAGEWVTVEAPPLSQGSHPVTITDAEEIKGRLIYASYTDGTVFSRRWTLLTLSPCTDNPCCSNHKEFAWVGEWVSYPAGDVK